MTSQSLPPDHGERLAAIHARGKNVIADAGAGTGKTTLVVNRLVEMVAPEDDAFAAPPLARVAAITFTRKAAGELKLRLREALLRELSRAALTDTRRDRLTAALATLDTGYVGTIHSFADRLLRMRPVEAWISPEYEIVEDESALVRETIEVFLQAVETGTLAAQLAGTEGAAAATAAEAAVVDALRVGLRVESETYEWGGARHGLDSLFARLVETRDVVPLVPQVPEPEIARFAGLVDELAGWVRGLEGDCAGVQFFARTLKRLQAVRDADDPVVVLKALLKIGRDFPKDGYKYGRDFLKHRPSWDAYKAFMGDDRATPVRATALLDDLERPYLSWLARRLVATAPAVLAMYEKVKARHQAVDQVDLLLKLRDLLRDEPEVRADYQKLFDHVFVDEFQDTDPLQAEIVLFLCEAGASAKTWRDVTVAPGKLTIVGDPKQSIYRFRRADIAVYAEVRSILERGECVTAKLTANFRCRPGLIEWLNHRFDDVLGSSEDGKPVFDPAAGTVVNERLVVGRKGDTAPAVEVLPLAADPDDNPTYRATEAKAIAAWLRRLVEGGKHEVVDLATGASRPARYGDVAILTKATTQLSLLFPELDRMGIPYAARGGQMFLEDPLHRQFLLGLRAISDRDDGVAQAALFRAPFFALDYDDLVRERAADDSSTHEGVLRAREAKSLVTELRRRRFDRLPGATARNLLERSAFGRTVARGDNGAQRLDSLRELCLALDTLAAAESLDFDGATARLRAWVERPVKLDPPRPVGTDAVQIMTTYQAKGLEFPIVVLWDACAKLGARDDRRSFVIGRDGKHWALSLDGLEWCEPEDSDFSARELAYLDAEAKRVAYVAATRARDLLVVPVAGDPEAAYVTGRLVGGAPAELMTTLDTYSLGVEPDWAKEFPAPVKAEPGDGAALAEEVRHAWDAAAGSASLPRFSPVSVSGAAHRAVEEAAEDGAPVRSQRTSRFGPVFGETVHRAIGFALADPCVAPAAAVSRAARLTGLTTQLAEATNDVARALAVLASEGLRRAPGADLHLEYPLAFAEGGKLLSGYVDLLATGADGSVTVIDFKTDAVPAGDVNATYAAYVGQVRGYARILVELGVAKLGQVRCGLLFTGEERIRWV